MKIIEALKSLKDLQVKQDDLRSKISQHSAYLSVETPVYPEQKKQVREWLQAHEDLSKEIERLSLRVALTNASTLVSITFMRGAQDLIVTRSITEWVIRRRKLAEADQKAWAQLTDRSLKEGFWPASQGAGAAPTKVEIVRCYDPVERDNKILYFKSQPQLIDSALEITNATTDLLPYPGTEPAVA